MSILTKIFGDANEKYLKRLQSIVEKINQLEPEFESFSNEQLKAKTQELKEKINRGSSPVSLDNILPEAFALVREAAKRTLSQRHFDCQLIGGVVLHQGKIAEMKTGEGKTLAATLPLYLNALEGKGCHLVTVNDYLAKRDTVWMGQIYHALGLSVGCIVHNTAFLYDPTAKVVETSSHLPKRSEGRSQRTQFSSHASPPYREVRREMNEVQRTYLRSTSPRSVKDEERDRLGGFKVIEDYLRPVSRKEAYLADITYGTNNEFGFDYLRDSTVYDLNQQVQREFNFAIVDEVDSILIDEARTPLIISAPDMESSKWYQDFARIIPKLTPEVDYQIDEKMKASTLTESGINKIEKILGVGNIYEERGMKYLRYLEQALRAETLFKRDRDYVVKDGQIIIVDEFTGRLMPGRRWSGGLHQAIEAKEGVPVLSESVTLASITFQNYFRMYKKLAGMTGTAATSAEEFDKVYKLEVIIVPTDKPMIRQNLSDRVYKTIDGKFQAAVREIKERHKMGQPVLVGTTSIEKNEYLGKLLEREGISHQILNAKHHEREGEIIAQAGKIGQVTIATNMAGRGVDIILGGWPPPAEIKNEKLKIKNDNESDLYEKWSEEHDKVVSLGGLHVIGTERHEARRIDNQLRGRTGRQGDPGSSQFFVSLEDDLMRIFGGEKIKSLMSVLKVPEDQPIEANLVSKVIEDAQSKIEGMNFDLRKHLLDYDDVLNKHREVIYKKRREFFEISDLRLKIKEWLKTSEEKKVFEEKIKELGDNFNQAARFVALRTLDALWIEHLENMEYLRDSVRLRAYGQRDPLVEYKSEAHKMFQGLLRNFEGMVANTILRVSVQPRVATPLIRAEQYVGSRRFNQRAKNKPGRNVPCPCGKKDPVTGKPVKYKKCCYPKFG